MAAKSLFGKETNHKPSAKRRRTRMGTAPYVFAVFVTVAVSRGLVSHALYNQKRFRSSAPPSTFGSTLSSAIGHDSGSHHHAMRSNLVLCASTKPTNKNARKRKRKHLRKKKSSSGDPSSSSSSRVAKSPGRSLSEDELHRHLNAKVNFGKHGPVGPRVRNRGLKPGTGECGTDGGNEGDVSIESNDNGNSRQRDQQFFLRQLNNRPTLVLNANYVPLGYMPLSLWSWQDAVKAIFKGSVTVVDVYPDLTVRASNLKVPLPSVIALNDYVPQKQTKPSFTRRNVFLRDEYRCQYCNERFHTADLSLDHVVPRSAGGPLSWDNAVTCCKKCNGRKGSTPLSEIGLLGMKLSRKPRCPSQMELAAISGRMVPKRVHPTWKPYLGIQERPAASKGVPGEKKGDEEFIDDRYFEKEANLE